MPGNRVSTQGGRDRLGKRNKDGSESRGQEADMEHSCACRCSSARRAASGKGAGGGGGQANLRQAAGRLWRSIPMRWALKRPKEGCPAVQELPGRCDIVRRGQRGWPPCPPSPGPQTCLKKGPLSHGLIAHLAEAPSSRTGGGRGCLALGGALLASWVVAHLFLVQASL